MKKHLIRLAALACALPAMAHAATLAPIRVILVGDSTVAPRNGYGDALCARFTPEVTCVNLAVNGRSSGSFRAEGRWDAVMKLLKDGGNYSANYVLVQFGHNDQPGKPGRSTDLVTEFPANMARYVTDVRAAGGTPVLVTPLTRRSFNGPYLKDDLAPWAAATRKIAASEHAALMDLNADSAAAVQAMGQDEADTLAVVPKPSTLDKLPKDPNKVEPKGGTANTFDRTHVGPKGARLFAGIAAHELKAAVPAIAPYFKAEAAE
jgi:lysophospholipase L1-like esterase